MRKHVAIYFKYFGYGEQDFVPCEICGAQANDIHHIENRGRGGNPSGDKDVIENLQAICRPHHLELGDKKQFLEYLKKIHADFMTAHAK